MIIFGQNLLETIKNCLLGLLAQCSQGSRYQSPFTPNAKKKYFWHKKKRPLAKTSDKKNSPYKKITTEISLINKLECDLLRVPVKQLL